jgi:hypothetical protein
MSPSASPVRVKDGDVVEEAFCCCSCCSVLLPVSIESGVGKKITKRKEEEEEGEDIANHASK